MQTKEQTILKTIYYVVESNIESMNQFYDSDSDIIEFNSNSDGNYLDIHFKILL